jgi:hypothetical protein
MISEQKLEANKLNALKSTGPKTPEGRAKSALNAIKHGLCAQTVIISSENSDEFRAFAKNLTTDFAPINQVERNMVKRIVSLSWRLERATKYESLVLDKILKAQFEADTQNNETNPTNVGHVSLPKGEASVLDSNSTPTVGQASVLDSNSTPDASRDSSKNETNPTPPLSKEELEFLQEDLLATAIYNDFRDEGLLERVRRYESQLSRELNSAMDILYKAQTIRIQRRQDDEITNKKLHEALTQQHEINQYREEMRLHEEREKTMSRRRILDFPGLEKLDEVKILSVVDADTFRDRANKGIDPVHMATEAIQRYNANPHFYTPKRYIETEANLYKRYHNTAVKRC